MFFTPISAFNKTFGHAGESSEDKDHGQKQRSSALICIKNGRVFETAG